MSAGAPLGNNNAGEGKAYLRSLKRALAHKYGSVDEGLFALAQVIVGKAEAGDGYALKELGDRFDGKPAQAIEHSGPAGQPIVIQSAQGDERL